MGPEAALPDSARSDTAFPEEAYRGHRWAELGAAAFFLFYFVLTLFDPVGSGLIRWLLTGAMGFNGFYFLRRAADPRPRLILDRQGIVDRTSVSGSTLFIPWTEVEGIQPTISRKMVEIRVRDLDQVRKDTGWVRRFWLGIRRLWGKKTIPILTGMLGLEKSELSQLIERGMIAQERRELGFGSDRVALDSGSTEPDSPPTRE